MRPCEMFRGSESRTAFLSRVSTRPLLFLPRPWGDSVRGLGSRSTTVGCLALLWFAVRGMVDTAWGKLAHRADTPVPAESQLHGGRSREPARQGELSRLRTMQGGETRAMGTRGLYTPYTARTLDPRETETGPSRAGQGGAEVTTHEGLFVRRCKRRLCPSGISPPLSWDARPYRGHEVLHVGRRLCSFSKRGGELSG